MTEQVVLCLACTGLSTDVNRTKIVTFCPIKRHRPDSASLVCAKDVNALIILSGHVQCKYVNIFGHLVIKLMHFYFILWMQNCWVLMKAYEMNPLVHFPFYSFSIPFLLAYVFYKTFFYLQPTPLKIFACNVFIKAQRNYLNQHLNFL